MDSDSPTIRAGGPDPVAVFERKSLKSADSQFQRKRQIRALKTQGCGIRKVLGFSFAILPRLGPATGYLVVPV